MDVRQRWTAIDQLCEIASHIGNLEIWVFGSALRSDSPSDLDALAIYGDRCDIVRLRGAKLWELLDPPIDLIAMTRAEESELEFISGTSAVRVL